MKIIKTKVPLSRMEIHLALELCLRTEIKSLEVTPGRELIVVGYAGRDACYSYDPNYSNFAKALALF